MNSDDELRDAADRFEKYFARGVFSRGGVCCLTNTGPLAGALEIDDVHPTPASPWLVQPFLDGEPVCTYSTAHHGRVSSHLMYRIPRQRKHSTGIQFQAIDATESLKLIEPIVAELGYTGQISFDFLATDDGLTFVECNPRDRRPAADAPRRARGGSARPASRDVRARARRRSAARARRAWPTASPINWTASPSPSTISRRSATPAAAGTTRCPTLYSALAICHSVGQSLREHMGHLVAIAGDMNWDGEHIDGMSNDDATLLTGLGAPVD